MIVRFKIRHVEIRRCKFSLTMEMPISFPVFFFQWYCFYSKAFFAGNAAQLWNACLACKRSWILPTPAHCASFYICIYIDLYVQSEALVLNVLFQSNYQSHKYSQDILIPCHFISHVLLVHLGNLYCLKDSKCFLEGSQIKFIIWIHGKKWSIIF